MRDIINNTSPIEAAASVVIFAIGLAYSRKKPFEWRRKCLFAYGLALILYTTLLRRIPLAWGSPAHTARLEFDGFNLSGCILNALLFLPLGLSLQEREWWFPILFSATVEIVQQVTHLGMFDVWDIVANTIGGMAGIAIGRTVRRNRRDKTGQSGI